ncbi:hypothetical protein EG327_002457 [Venturia inaequalis]|uniref:Uncharacterized protein n=1 Tax=Venturia inaequalis TaxID=5025 RepID=A0A8H3ZEV1_VENIN|nr:hypothetical protein EG327_002457 [Venturia inaequalis]
MNVPNNYDLFILTNRDINGIFALSFKPAANTNKATTMRNVSTGIKKFDEWYLDNNTITNNGYNDTILQFWTLHKESWGFVAWWNCTPQDDGTLQISAAGSFFLGLDDTKTQAKLHPLVDFGKRGVTDTQYYVRRGEDVEEMGPAKITANTQAMLRKKEIRDNDWDDDYYGCGHGLVFRRPDIEDKEWWAKFGA